MSHAWGALPIFFIIIGSSYAQWAYTIVAQTTEGRPCFGECVNNKCLVDWYNNRLNCNMDVNNVAPKYRTAQVSQLKIKYCLSNCGYFGEEYEWCITTKDKRWDYCNSSADHVTVYKRKCKAPCVYRPSENYFWCFIEGGTWQKCAPPRESPDKRWQLTLDD